MRGRGVELAASDRNVKIYQRERERERIREREREREIGILSPSSASLLTVQSEQWRIIIWIERHGWRGKFNMQIARHYASFIPVFRPVERRKGPGGSLCNSSFSSRETKKTLSLPLVLSKRREETEESWSWELVDETGKRKRQLDKGKNKEMRDGRWRKVQT